MIKVNGKAIDIVGVSLMEYLLAESYNLSRIAIEYNGEILPKSEYANTAFCDGDSVEIVSFVGGG